MVDSLKAESGNGKKNVNGDERIELLPPCAPGPARVLRGVVVRPDFYSSPTQGLSRKRLNTHPVSLDFVEIFSQYALEPEMITE